MQIAWPGRLDPDRARAASPSGLDILTMAEFVSVHDRDPEMLEDSPPSLGVSVSSTSPQMRKSSRRRSVVLRYAVTRKAVTRKATRKTVTRKRCTRNIH